MAENAPVSPFVARNSEGQTVAESYRQSAEALEREARIYRSVAASMEDGARNYREMAEAWERETFGRKWCDLQAGDVITLRVFDRQEGWTRERRTVVAVNWPVLTLSDYGREYDFDASSDPDRDVRLVP